MIKGNIAWSLDRITESKVHRMELADLTRFNDHFYFAFREGDWHYASPAGRGRILRSADGESWESVALLEWDSADVREPKLSVTADNHLLVNTSLYYVSDEPRGSRSALDEDESPPPEAESRQRDPKGQYYQLEGPGTPETDDEKMVARQSVTWLSADGKTFSSGYTCPTGINTWRWEIVWHNGMGYSVGYCGKDEAGTLYRTRDGKSFRPLVENFLPDGKGNETSITWDTDGRAIALVRDAATRPERREGIGGMGLPRLGFGKAPYYTEWEWHDITFEWNGRRGSADEMLKAPFGGPQLLRLSDGRIIAAGRNWGPDMDDGYICLFWVDPDEKLLTFIDHVDGTTYGGMAEHDSHLYIGYCMHGVKEAKVAKWKIPS